MLESPLPLFRRLPGPVRLLVVGTLVNKLGSFILPYLTLVLKREFQMSAGAVGALVMAYGIGSLISILAGGVLTDVLGRRATLLLSLLGSGALAVAMGASPTVDVFVPLLLVFGFLAELYRPASSAIIGDLLPSADRATGFAALRVAVNLGFAVGMALGGVLVDWSWRALFVIDGATTVLFGVVVYFFIHETKPGPATTGVTAVSPAAAASVWTDGVYAQLMLCSLAFSTVVFSFLTVLPLTVTLWAGYPAAVYGAIVGMNGLVIAIFEISLVVWLKRFRRLRVAALGLALSGLGFGLTGLVPHWTWFLATLLIWTAGEILTLPQQMAFIADWAPPEARGRYLGLYGASWSLGFALNPILLLPLHARLGEALFWPVSLLLLVPAALVSTRLDRVADRPELLRGRSEGALPEPPLPTLSPEAGPGTSRP